ncbi:transmembrane protein 138 isoform X1 [Heterodontus francisci]|uniref:transmembrane protein 138 isoform X1 n=1 Tax=Heterodontus francisci TaxID=7792 RepID=UPI00355C4141
MLLSLISPKPLTSVSRCGLFRLLAKIGCPPKLLSIVTSFHDNMKGTIQHSGASSDPFPILSGVKQGCVLAPTLFGIFFSLLLSHAFKSSEEGIFLHTRSDGRLFNLARLRVKTKVRKVLIRKLLFAGNAALTSHMEECLQRLIDRFAAANNEFGLTISLRKTNIMGQDVRNAPSIKIGNHTLDVVQEFTYLGSTITSNLYLDAEINKRVGKASAAMSRLAKRVWENGALTWNTKVRVYQACVLSTLLYGSEAWTMYVSQERRLNSFHLRCFRRILGIRWQDCISNTQVLEAASIPSIYTLLSQRRLRWLGHVSRMADGRIPKNTLCSEYQTHRPSISPL